MRSSVRDAARQSMFSFVLETPAATPDEARRHFTAKLSVETDPADVHADMGRGRARFHLLDVRSTSHYEQCHIPGALGMPWRSISVEALRAAGVTRDDVLVVYCWGPGCNAATRAAARLGGLGYRVKEMIGGIEYWRREGHAVEGTDPDGAPLVA